jgi:hypothetical protein
MFFSAPISPAFVRDGTNVVAVELHQSDLTSSDLSFVLELQANTPLGNLPPVVKIDIAPAGHIVGSNEIFTISVNASDPETNVMRIDLMQDGVMVRSIFASAGVFAWSNGVAGLHEFTARATDTTGMMGMSPTARVLISRAGFHGQSAFFPQFSSTNGLILQSAATIGSNVLRLSPAVANTRGAAWLDTPQKVVDGFVSEFLFRITSRNNNGADGFAFVIAGTPQPAVGSGLLSYSGLTNSLAIEFDTFMNDSASDPNHFHISAHSRGTAANTTDESASLGLYMPANDFSEGMVHRVKIEYASGILRVFLDNFFVAILNVNVNLNTLLNLPDGRAWVGFTAGCGSNFENHDLWAWSYQSSIPLRIERWIPESDGSIVLGFMTATGQSYTVEYSTNLTHWMAATPTVGGTGALVLWRDMGPPGTESLPGAQPQRFYRVRVE